MADYLPGDTIYWSFPVQNPSTGAATNADSLPSGTLYKNSILASGINISIANPTSGIYFANFTIPSSYSTGDNLTLVVQATVNSVLGKSPIWQTKLGKSQVNLAEILGVAISGNLASVFSYFFNVNNPNINVNQIPSLTNISGIIDYSWNKGQSELSGVPQFPVSRNDMLMWQFERSHNLTHTTASGDYIYRTDNITILGSGQLSDDGTTFIRGAYI